MLAEQHTTHSSGLERAVNRFPNILMATKDERAEEKVEQIQRALQLDGQALPA